MSTSLYKVGDKVKFTKGDKAAIDNNYIYLIGNVILHEEKYFYNVYNLNDKLIFENLEQTVFEFLGAKVINKIKHNIKWL
jgi:hypothetical protein